MRTAFTSTVSLQVVHIDLHEPHIDILILYLMNYYSLGPCSS